MAKSTTGTVKTARGSYITTQHTERKMKLCGVYESELRAIGLFNTISAGAASLGTGLISFAGAQWLELRKDPKADNADVIQAAITFCIAGCVLCFVIAGVATYFRRSEVSRILNDSKPV